MASGHTERLPWSIKTAFRAFDSMDTGLFTFPCMISRDHVPCLVLTISPPACSCRHHILGHGQTSQAVAEDSCLDLSPVYFTEEISRPLATVPPFLQTHRRLPRQSTLLGEHVSPLAPLLLYRTSRHRKNNNTFVISLVIPLNTSRIVEQGQSHLEYFLLQLYFDSSTRLSHCQEIACSLAAS